MQKINLAELISPVTESEFFKNHWPQEPLFIPVQKNKLKTIFDIPELKDIESLVEKRSLKVRACLPDLDDEQSSIHLDPADALKAYRNSMTLLFDSMQTQNKVIADSLDQLRQDLGLIVGGENDLCKARSLAYATPAGGGTRLHFDANANFIIQIYGSKQWTLASNTSVKNPTERFTAGSLELPRALENQCHDILLDEAPDDATEINMEPGCVLFVPRGYWHATTTFEDSLSLNFTFSQPTWADVFTRSLQEFLLTSADWRELADGLASQDPQRKAISLARFESLVKKLSQELPEISGEKLLVDSNLLIQAKI